MNKYNINGNTVTTNLNRNKVYEVTEPRFSYPYSNTSQIRKITQTFVTGSDNVPPFNPNLVHPDYPNAYILNQTDNGVSPTGFAEFTREYIEQLTTEIYAEPTTIMFQLPTLYTGDASWIRNFGQRATTATDWDNARFFRKGQSRKIFC